MNCELWHIVTFWAQTTYIQAWTYKYSSWMPLPLKSSKCNQIYIYMPSRKIELKIGPLKPRNLGAENIFSFICMLWFFYVLCLSDSRPLYAISFIFGIIIVKYNQ